MNQEWHPRDLENSIAQRKSNFFYVNSDSIRCIMRNLRFLYSSVVASENLLSCAAEQLKKHTSGIYRDKILSYYLEHLEEERDHAKWLADDLAAHGVIIEHHDLDAMRMIGAQYYMIFHCSPYCLLGYMAVVEGVPTPLSEIEKLESIYGKKLFRFSRFHAIKDMEHKHDIFERINSAPPLISEQIGRSASITLDCIECAAKSWIKT